MSLGNAKNTFPGEGKIAAGNIGLSPRVNANQINKKIKTPNMERTIDCDFDKSPLSLNIQLTGNDFTDGYKNKKEHGFFNSILLFCIALFMLRSAEIPFFYFWLCRLHFDSAHIPLQAYQVRYLR